MCNENTSLNKGDVAVWGGELEGKIVDMVEVEQLRAAGNCRDKFVFDRMEYDQGNCFIAVDVVLPRGTLVFGMSQTRMLRTNL